MRYRVDRSQSGVVTPVGMNSILYIGGSKAKALKIYNEAQVHLNPWGKPDVRYGVSLAESPLRGEDKVVKWKIN